MAYSQEELQEILQRAARLQIETQDQQQNQDHDDPVPDQDKISLDLLAESAAEAGLQAETIYLSAAELESRLYRKIPARAIRRAELSLGVEDRAICFSVRIAAGLERCIKLIQDTAESRRYGMRLEKVHGKSIAEGGVIEYATAGMSNWTTELSGSEFAYHMLAVDIKSVFISLRKEDTGSGCTMTLYAPVSRGLSLNNKVSTGLSVGTGVLALGLLWIFLPFSPAITGLAALAGGGGLAGLTRLAYRKSYSGYMKKADAQLRSFASTIQALAQTGGDS